MQTKNADTLTRFQSAAYGLPLLSVAFLFGPITLLQGIYAKHFGLALTAIATVLLIARFFDAITDPLIGYCADRYYARRGNRKPFIIIGAMLFIISSWFLYVPFGFDPEQGHNSVVSTGYFLVWFLAFYLGYTLFEIPHIAWGGELVSDSREKNTVYGMRSFCNLLGVSFFYVVPLLPWFATSEFTPETLKWSVLLAASMLLPLLFLCIKYVPNKSMPLPVDSRHDRPAQKDTSRVVLRAIFTNKPFLILMAGYICSGFGAGMWFTLLFIYVDGYLNLGQHFALVSLVGFGLSLVSLRFWVVLANHWGKQTTWIASTLLLVIGTVGTGFLSPDTAGWLELLSCKALVACSVAGFQVLVPSLLSDIVDYGTWKSGTDRGAVYFSLYTFTFKAVFALGGALALAIAGWSGFDPATTVHSDPAVTGLRLGIAWIPAAFIVLAMVFIARIPITGRCHAILRRRLDSRSIREVHAIGASLQPDTKSIAVKCPNDTNYSKPLLKI